MEEKSDKRRSRKRPSQSPETPNQPVGRCDGEVVDGAQSDEETRRRAARTSVEALSRDPGQGRLVVADDVEGDGSGAQDRDGDDEAERDRQKFA